MIPGQQIVDFSEEPRIFNFYSKPEYYAALVTNIASTHKNDRVVLATMSFWPEKPSLHPVLNELYAAAARGVRVHLLLDAISFMLSQGATPGPLLLSRRLPKRLSAPFRGRLEALERLKSVGGSYTITNLPDKVIKNPYSGRSHIKFAVINDDVFVGGCNLTAVEDYDLMAGWKDSSLANWLDRFASEVNNTGNVKAALLESDVRETIDAETTLLIDAGVKGQSCIFEAALELIDNAQEFIFITCQYFPNNITARHLQLAQSRGVRVEIVYNHPGKHIPPMNLLHQAVLQNEKRKLPPQMFDNQLAKQHQFIHAKLLSSEQATMVGSHNYVSKGVEFGTAEIAIYSTNQEFGLNAVASITEQIAAGTA